MGNLKVYASEKYVQDYVNENIDKIKKIELFESNNLPTSLSNIYYGNDEFVGFIYYGDSNCKVLHSTDGINWTQNDTTATPWAFSGGKFINLSNNIIEYSDDGITWTKGGTLPSISGYWNSIAYGNDTFIAVGSPTKLVHSTDNGITWTESSLPISYNGGCNTCFGNGRFIIIGGNEVAYSSDGINWTKHYSTLPTTISSLNYSNNRFICCTNNNTILFSSDGIYWSQSYNLPSASGAWYSFCYGNGVYVGITSWGGCEIAYSYGHNDWTKATLPFSSSGTNLVCYGNGKFLAIGSGGEIAYSYDGINWFNSTLIQSGKDVTKKTADTIKPYLSGLATESYVNNKANDTLVLKENTLVQSNIDVTKQTASAIKPHLDLIYPVDKNDRMTQSVGRDKDGLLYASNLFAGIVLVDCATGYEYLVQMENGNLVYSISCTGIEITKYPEKMEFVEGEDNGLDEIEVSAVYADGSKVAITDYECIAISEAVYEIVYTEKGIKHTAIIEFTVIPFDPTVQLIDFYYTAESNGTYTITGWKGTLNGEPSTRLIVPDNELINV